MKDAARSLADQWMMRAGRRMLDASHYDSSSLERQAMEHGAIIYFNCAQQLILLAGLGASEPPPEAIQAEPQKQHHRQA